MHQMLGLCDFEFDIKIYVCTHISEHLSYVAQMNESAILGTKLSVQVARCVTWRIARCYDPDALFKVRPCPPVLIALAIFIFWC